jgi:hypothetical protein
MWKPEREDHILGAVHRSPPTNIRRVFLSVCIELEIIEKILGTDDFYPYHLQLVQNFSSEIVQYHTWTVLLSGCNQGYKFSLMSCYRLRLRAQAVVLTGRWHIDIQMTSLQSNFQHRFPAGAWCGMQEDCLLVESS